MISPQTADADPLANPVWHALTGRQAELALGDGAARTFRPNVARFSAIATPNAAAYTNLARLLGPGGEARLLRPAAPEFVPAEWTVAMETPLLQMVADGPPPERVDPPEGLIRLGPDDGDEMLALARRTEPGPFERDTVLIGGYIGLRRDGRLVAMAGHRLRPAGHTEISAICVAPEYRGQGLATRLTLLKMAEIHDAGEIPMLHVFLDNEGAQALYLKLGFHESRRLAVRWLTVPS